MNLKLLHKIMHYRSINVYLLLYNKIYFVFTSIILYTTDLIQPLAAGSALVYLISIKSVAGHMTHMT